MGFNLVKENNQINITIDSLTSEMMSDLIACYAADIPSTDVESRFLLERANINPQYPIIPKDVIDLFYSQLDIVKSVIINIIIGNWHTGLVVPSDITIETEDWQWGNTPATKQELKDILFFIISRDFNEAGTWIYEFTQGNFEYIRPFLDLIVDLSIAHTDGGDYDECVILIKENYPFIK